MDAIVFALQFRGQAQPRADAPGVVEALTHATGRVHAPDLAGGSLGHGAALDPGVEARFTSIVTMLGETRFTESGTIDFGNGNALTFVTLGEGVIEPAPDGNGSAGSILWRVLEGHGAFAGVSGYITSNFRLSDTGEITDTQVHQLYRQG